MTEVVNKVQEETITNPYGFIYITTNLADGKRYLGQKKFDRRWQDYLGSGKAFKNALKKYGRKSFIRNIILICYSAEELNTAEYELSVFFNVVESDNWYNLVYGGGTTLGIVVSEETRIKQSEARKRNSIIHPEFDEHHSKKMVEYYQQHPEAKERVGRMFEQLWKDPEYVSYMLESREKYWSDENNHIQRGMTIKKTWEDPNVKEARLKGLKEWTSNPEKHELRSEKSKRNWDKPRYRESQINRNIGSGNPMYGVHRYGIDSTNFIPVYCIELNRIFWGATQAEEELHIRGSDIARCCKKRIGHMSAGKHPTTKEKLHWNYIYDFVNEDGVTINGAISLGYVTEKQVNEYLNSLKKETDN